MRLSLPTTPNLFPTYLTPSLPFGRRKSSTDSNASNTSTNSSVGSTSAATSTAQTFLGGHASHLHCARCLSDLAPSNQIISKGFTGRHGRAYLVAPPSSLDSPTPPPTTAKYGKQPNLPNTYTHKPVARNLVTGAHTVSDISCAQCGSVLGWKYIAAEEEAQRYKVGKFILETKRVCRSNCWEGDDTAPSPVATGTKANNNNDSDDIEFDSQDEDECEDLFLGVWNAQAAGKRRKMKAFTRDDE